MKKGFTSIKTGFVLMLHAQKKLVNKNRIYLHKKRFFQKKSSLFFGEGAKKTKEKKRFSSNRFYQKRISADG